MTCALLTPHPDVHRWRLRGPCVRSDGLLRLHRSLGLLAGTERSAHTSVCVSARTFAQAGLARVPSSALAVLRLLGQVMVRMRMLCSHKRVQYEACAAGVHADRDRWCHSDSLELLSHTCLRARSTLSAAVSTTRAPAWALVVQSVTLGSHGNSGNELCQHNVHVGRLVYPLVAMPAVRCQYAVGWYLAEAGSFVWPACRAIWLCCLL